MRFPITDASPIRFSVPLPSACDVVIIGGGVIGVMTAWHLADRGLTVTLCEKGRVAGEQSSRNWGWIRQQGRDPAELPIMVESLRLWKSLSQQLGDGLGFRQTGVMYLANTDSDLAGFETWLPHARAHDLDTRLMTRAEAMSHLPGAASPWRGALFTPSDARAEPWRAVPMLADAAVARGVTISEDCAVRALDIAAGRVTGVITEHGRIACDQVVLAGAHGITIPQLSVLASVAATEPMPEIYPGAAADNHFAFRRRADGGYSLAPGAEHDVFTGRDAFASFGAYLPVLKKDFRSTHFRLMAPAGFPDAWGTPRHWSPDKASPFERTRILNPAPNMATLRRVQTAFGAAFPCLGPPKLKAAWAGMIDTLPDVVPVIDRAPIPGLIIATGMSGHGFGIGPGIGRVVADLVVGNPTGHDLHRFRMSRFIDGSRLAPRQSL